MPQTGPPAPSLRHYHVHQFNQYEQHHNHDPADHDNDGRHNDGAFGDYDLLYGPAHYPSPSSEEE